MFYDVPTIVMEGSCWASGTHIILRLYAIGDKGMLEPHLSWLEEMGTMEYLQKENKVKSPGELLMV